MPVIYRPKFPFTSSFPLGVFVGMPMNPKARKQQRIDDGSDPSGARLQHVIGHWNHLGQQHRENYEILGWQCAKQEALGRCSSGQIRLVEACHPSAIAGWQLLRLAPVPSWPTPHEDSVRVGCPAVHLQGSVAPPSLLTRSTLAVDGGL